jgi:epoxyqueuosine reductase
VSTPKEELRASLHALGFDVVRFVDLENSARDRRAEHNLDTWLQAGFQADMTWMERTADKRKDPKLVLDGARSAVLLGVNYWPGKIEQPKARWARYALYQDYHDTLKLALESAGKILEKHYGVTAADYRYYVDAGPVLERAWAERGGVGFVGKNAMVISKDFGNWLFLSEILTRIPFEPDAPLAPNRTVLEASDVENVDAALAENRVGLYCGSCTRCMTACPTQAIREPGVVDANRCISYQTIENKGIIPRELRAGIGNRIYGCDVCLEVCPWNRFAQEGRRMLLLSRYDLAELSLKDLLELTPERFAEFFRKTPIKRTKITGILRNACIVAANTRARECLPQLVRLASHASAIVRAHAVWAVYRLAGDDAQHLLASARAREADALVLAEYPAEET